MEEETTKTNVCFVVQSEKDQNPPFSEQNNNNKQISRQFPATYTIRMVMKLMSEVTEWSINSLQLTHLALTS
jgi:hypothetical protein